MATTTPRINDVLFGRGAVINSHPGNLQFRSLVVSHERIFSQEKVKKQKRTIAMQIFSQIQSLQPPGRFLVENHSIDLTKSDYSHVSVPSSSEIHPNILSKSWLVVERKKALDKIMHRLRERIEVGLAVAPRVQTRIEGSRFDYPEKNHFESISSQEDVDENQVQEGRARGLPTELGYSILNNSPEPHSNILLESTPTIGNPSMSQQVKDTVAPLHGTILRGRSRSDIDFELDALVRWPTPQLEQESLQQLPQYTLQQWVEISVHSFSINAASTVQVSTAMENYIKPALLIAIKFIECILDADKDELTGHRDPIPLACITPESIMLGKTRDHVDRDSDGTQVIIDYVDYVWVMSMVGDNPDKGDVMERLYAVGKVLYYLFSAGVLPMLVDDTPATQNASISSINLNSEEEREYSHAKKKHYWRSAQVDDEISNCVTKMESIGVPLSLCCLVKNLLGCRLGPCFDDEAYTSFVDLHVDLQLMLDNPSSFLDNIRISTNPKLTIPDKLFGRDKELIKLEELYQNHVTGKVLNGAIISGGAGAGKSKLAMHLRKLTNRSKGYFLSAKFEHNQMSLKPLSNITSMFDSLCEMFFNDSTHSQILEVEIGLMSALGSQANLLGVVVPNLQKLMPTWGRVDKSANFCVDSSVSMRYLLSELLLVISSHSKPITFVIDDIQFADPASLLLIGNLLLSAQGGSSVFFALCHRNDENILCGQFNVWLESIAAFSLESIKVESITPVAVNDLTSEALHLSPRLTRPLSSVLHHMTMGNPLFLRQLLDFLTEQGCIYIDMTQQRWAWDLDMIMELEISESVLALLVSNIRQLSSDMQLGLQIASCIGSSITESMIGYLSKDLGIDLKDVLLQVSQKGFMIDTSGSTKFHFVHDKIQEAVYEMMPDQQRRENHMRIGLALCNESLTITADNEELFFAAVNQINQGGPTAVHDPSQMIVIAELNLKAGRCSINLSDYNTALLLFQHGISFLGDDHWMLSYDLSLELYTAVTEVALVLNNLSAVIFYSNEVVSHARCFDDKLDCMFTSTKAVGVVALLPAQSIQDSLSLLTQCGEDLPRSMGDDKLSIDIDRMITTLQSTPDDIICHMHESYNKKMTIIIDIYAYLGHVLQFFMPWLVGSVSLRMVELTIKMGLSAKSPLAFAHFGGVLVSAGRIKEGCRLGRLALKLVERKGSLQFQSRVIRIVYDRIFWVSKPLQSIVEAYSLGHKTGRQSGDAMYAFNNLLLAICTDYFAGQRLDVVQKSMLDFIPMLQSRGVKIFYQDTVLLLSQIMVLKEGLHMSAVSPGFTMPSEAKLLAVAGPGPTFSSFGKVNHLARAFLFRRTEDPSFQFDISGTVTANHHLLNIYFLMGYFFEGLASFQLARQTSACESAQWIERGQSMLANMRCWSEHSSWNWENKMLLLEAESLFATGEFDQVRSLYDSAVLSAREHKFVHEEAIASELAGIFYHETGHRQESFSYLMHSINCYDKWGAHAVARRVETVIQSYFGIDLDPFSSSSVAVDTTSLDHLFAKCRGSQKRRLQG